MCRDCPLVNVHFAIDAFKGILGLRTGMQGNSMMQLLHGLDGYVPA